MTKFKIGDQVRIRSVNGLNLTLQGDQVKDHEIYPIGEVATVIEELNLTGLVRIRLTSGRVLTLSPLRLIFVDQEEPTLKERVINKIKLLDKRFEARKGINK